MGRKPSNVYDYFNRLEPLDGKGLVRYECKKCLKQYASNATRLAEHLKQTGCSPTFQSNQRSTAATVASVPAMTAAAAVSAATLAVSGAAGAYAAQNPHVLSGLKKADHLITGMLDAEISLEPDLLLRLAKLSTCAIADALAQMKIQGHLVDVDLVRGYENPLAMNICGPALTVKVMPSNGPAVKKLPFSYVDTSEMGQVIVISAPVGATTAVFGGLLATAAKARSVAGVVTDGRVRDVGELCAAGFPAFAKGTSVHGQRGATTVVDVGCPITVAGCVVRNADIIRGDINGVIVIPAERASDVALKAELIEEQDNKIADAVQQGEPLERSFQRFRSKNV
jgi:regulator of RNase E activity RraA